MLVANRQIVVEGFSIFYRSLTFRYQICKWGIWGLFNATANLLSKSEHADSYYVIGVHQVLSTIGGCYEDLLLFIDVVSDSGFRC